MISPSSKSGKFWVFALQVINSASLTVKLIKGGPLAKVRHISYRAEDVDAMAKFFVDAMGMTVVQKRKDNSTDLSDGSVNIAILPLAANRSRRAGLDHIGFSAEDGQQIRRMEAAGATEESTRSLYEKRSKGPEGIIIDVGRWPGSAPLEK